MELSKISPSSTSQPKKLRKAVAVVGGGWIQFARSSVMNASILIAVEVGGRPRANRGGRDLFRPGTEEEDVSRVAGSSAGPSDGAAKRPGG
jgi:hypothetical protein